MNQTTTPPAGNGNGNKQQVSVVRSYLRDPAILADIANALPRHMTAERMARVALTALTRTPLLEQCTPQSFMRCLLDLSAWGLEPDGRHAHLIPFKDHKRNIVECTLIIDYKGLVQLAYRSGQILKIHADVVYEGDVFEYNLGEVTKHTPWPFRLGFERPEERGNIIAVYCLVKLKNGSTKCEVLTRDEVEAVRKRSKAGQSGPWVTDWSEMAKKTAFRRVSKWLPLSSEVLEAFDKDDDKIIDAVDHAPVVQQGSRSDALGSKLAEMMSQSEEEPKGIEHQSEQEPFVPKQEQKTEEAKHPISEQLQKAKAKQAKPVQGELLGDA